MKKTDNRHYNRRSKRLLGLQMDYYCLFIRAKTDKGIIEDVIYSGDTWKGQLYLKINGEWYIMCSRKLKPAFKDLPTASLIKSAEPLFEI